MHACLILRQEWHGRGAPRRACCVQCAVCAVCAWCVRSRQSWYDGGCAGGACVAGVVMMTVGMAAVGQPGSHKLLQNQAGQLHAAAAAVPHRLLEKVGHVGS